MQVSCVLLAAGLSSRMGENKFALDWFGAPLIAAQIELLNAAGVREIVIVGGHEYDALKRVVAPYLTPQVTLTYNPSYRESKSASVISGFAQLSGGGDNGDNGGSEGALVLSVDQPRTPAVLRELIAQHAPGTISVPRYEGGSNGGSGHPILISRKFYREVGQISDSELGLRGLLSRASDSVKAVSVSDDTIYCDLNTPNDYRAALAKWQNKLDGQNKAD